MEPCRSQIGGVVWLNVVDTCGIAISLQPGLLPSLGDTPMSQRTSSAMPASTREKLIKGVWKDLIMQAVRRLTEMDSVHRRHIAP